MQKYQLYVDGAYIDPASGRWFPSDNPFTGEPWAEIPRANAEDVEKVRARSESPNDIVGGRVPDSIMNAVVKRQALKRAGTSQVAVQVVRDIHAV